MDFVKTAFPSAAKYSQALAIKISVVGAKRESPPS